MLCNTSSIDWSQTVKVFIAILAVAKGRMRLVIA